MKIVTSKTPALAALAGLLALTPVWATPQAHAPAGTRTVQIPSGTPVTVHVMGRNVSCQNFPGEKNLKNDLVLQVDQDVVVDGVLVVPKGGFGLGIVDSSHLTFNRRTQARIVDSCVFHLLGVFTMGSVLTSVDPEPIELKREKEEAFGLTFREGATFTGKLQAATVYIPR